MFMYGFYKTNIGVGESVRPGHSFEQWLHCHKSQLKYFLSWDNNAKILLKLKRLKKTSIIVIVKAFCRLCWGQPAVDSHYDDLGRPPQIGYRNLKESYSNPAHVPTPHSPLISKLSPKSKPSRKSFLFIVVRDLRLGFGDSSNPT